MYISTDTSILNGEYYEKGLLTLNIGKSVRDNRVKAIYRKSV